MNQRRRAARGHSRVAADSAAGAGLVTATATVADRDGTEADAGVATPIDVPAALDGPSTASLPGASEA